MTPRVFHEENLLLETCIMTSIHRVRGRDGTARQAPRGEVENFGSGSNDFNELGDASNPNSGSGRIIRSC
jgi:hypothetical protein